MINKLSEYISSSKLARYLAIALVVLVILVAINNIWDIFAKWGFVNPPLQIPNTITITADGKATAAPDTAQISVSVVTDGATADDVQQKNAKTANNVIDYLKSNGVESKDIKTMQYNLYPRYDYYNGKQTLAGFSLTQTMDIKIRDLKKVGEIITGTVARGANQISSVNYFIDDPETFKAQARAQAFDKARAKAKEVAKLAGVRLGDIVTFSESVNGYPIPMYEKAYSSVGGYGGGGITPDTQAGSQDVVISVSVVFEIK